MKNNLAWPLWSTSMMLGSLACYEIGDQLTIMKDTNATGPNPLFVARMVFDGLALLVSFFGACTATRSCCSKDTHEQSEDLEAARQQPTVSTPLINGGR